MNNKVLRNSLPIEIINKIYEYDNTYVLRMNNVIKEIEKLKKAIDEYWYMGELLYYMPVQEELYRRRLGLPTGSLDWSLPNKRCFRFWNTYATA